MKLFLINILVLLIFLCIIVQLSAAGTTKKPPGSAAGKPKPARASSSPTTSPKPTGVGPSTEVDESKNSFCPVNDIINTKCMGPKDCLYPNPDRCDQFVQCEANADQISGRPYFKDCPASLLWNDTDKICDGPQKSTCPK